jgi:glycosyltransferase involved in cell wall biosynthesis
MENLKPAISVLLPVRQWRDTTLASVVSVLNQTFESLEILIIGQEDAQALKARLPTDNRLRFIARQKPGIVSALNTGLANARAPYIARMDDDDIAYAQRFSTQLDYLHEHHEVALCGARIRFIDQLGHSDNIGHGNQQYAHWLNSLTTPAQIRAACYIESPLPHPTLLAHRDTWNILGGYRELDGPEDYDLILRAMLHGMNMGKPEEVLLDWREHAQRLTYTDARYRREAFTERRAWAAVQSMSGLGLDKGRTTWLCGTGRNARYWHDALTKANVKVQGFVDFKRRGPQRHKRGLPIVSYDELPDMRGDSLIITALTQPQARIQLLNYFSENDWQSGKDYLLGG